MKISKFVNINKNILLEYIYDDSNLIGESYNIIYNSKTGINSFCSSDEERPPKKFIKFTNNDLYNQLYSIDPVTGKYGRIPQSSSKSNNVDSNYSFLQVKNYPQSIPVRYDTIKVHIPTNYVFDGYKGFYIRVSSLDFDNQNRVELSNYFFNITDIDQNYKIEYSNPTLFLNESQWGKYLQIQIPSVHKVSNQRVNDVVKKSSINYNLTNGIGLSKTSPIFVDFYFIKDVDVVNDNSFFNLDTRVSISFPQTPEFEKLGVKIEKSINGDYFEIYPVYNNSISEFSIFLNESYYSGNRYYVECQVDLFEKNTKTKSYTFIMTENFNQKIEYRPIIKLSTTTAIIDVTLKLIDSVDGSEIIRKSSYGMLQNELTNYSAILTKLDMSKAEKKSVLNLKHIINSSTGNSPFGNKSSLIIEKMNFSMFSQSYSINSGKYTVLYHNEKHYGNNQLAVVIFPFDNIVKFNIIINQIGSTYIPYDLSNFINLKMTIKSDEKDIDFYVYQESPENNYEIGHIIFKIPESKYKDIKKISTSHNLFYINGVDSSGNKVVLYSGVFIPYDKEGNIALLESDFKQSLTSNSTVINETNILDPKSDEIRKIVNDGQSSAKGVGYSGLSINKFNNVNSINNI